MQPTLTVSAPEQWIEFHRKQVRESEARLTKILNLFEDDDTFVARIGLWAAYQHVIKCLESEQ